MPQGSPLSDLIVRFASSGALGLGIAAVPILALAILLPRQDRAKIRMPAVLLAIDLLLLPLRRALDPESAPGHALRTFSLLLVLVALGRSGFLLIVDHLLGERLRRPLPRIIREIVQALVYVGVAIVTLRAAGVEPGSLLTTSALLTAVIGLSLQDTLGNLFAGLSIQAQHPFEVGDWIQLDSESRSTGQVIEINWRATKVLTSEMVELIIPNALLAKTTIRNFTKPSGTTRRTIEILAPYDASPHAVEQALLRALWNVPEVLASPPAFVTTTGFAESGMTYHLCYYLDNFVRRDRVDSMIRQRIWFSFQRAGIAMPYPTREVHLHDAAHASREREATTQEERRAEALRGVDFLASVPPPLVQRLAALARTCRYARGEVVIRQGDEGQELFIVLEGEVAVLVGRTGGSVAQVARLGPGSFFGEMSLMTGEPRSATIHAVVDTVLVKVDRDAFQEILAAAPDLAERISATLVERQIQLEENVSSRSAKDDREAEARSSVLLDKIRRFFKL